jgi:hypothetical protein
MQWWRGWGPRSSPRASPSGRLARTSPPATLASCSATSCVPLACPFAYVSVYTCVGLVMTIFLCRVTAQSSPCCLTFKTPRPLSTCTPFGSQFPVTIASALARAFLRRACGVFTTGLTQGGDRALRPLGVVHNQTTFYIGRVLRMGCFKFIADAITSNAENMQRATALLNKWGTYVGVASRLTLGFRGPLVRSLPSYYPFDPPLTPLHLHLSRKELYNGRQRQNHHDVSTRRSNQGRIGTARSTGSNSSEDTLLFPQHCAAARATTGCHASCFAASAPGARMSADVMLTWRNGTYGRRR